MMTPSVNDVLYPDALSRTLATQQLRLEIIALRRAIGSGATRVSYDGKSVDYDDLAGMRRRLSAAEAEFMAISGYSFRRPQAGFATFSRGNR